MGMGCTNMLSQSQLSKIKMLASRPDICKRNSHLKLSRNLDWNPLPPNMPKEHVYDVSGQTPTCAKVALEHYNRSYEDEYEMVKALDSVSSFFNGVWVHVNFLAKLKGATQCPDLVPKFFFAEEVQRQHQFVVVGFA
uniref:DUF3615 domain-containing protein n=1 Tax=Oryza glaberrima TaxID=4538 RepID=I1PAD2_ORYGL